MNFKIALALSAALIATVASPRILHADELVNNSCDILTDAAKARAEVQSKDFFPHLLAATEGSDDGVTLGAAGLPALSAQIKAAIPPRAFAMSRDVKHLRERMTTMEDDIKSQQSDLHKIDEDINNSRVLVRGQWVRKPTVSAKKFQDLQDQRKDLVADLADQEKKKTELAQLLAASESQLTADMQNVASNTYPAAQMFGYQAGSLGYLTCTGNFWVGAEQQAVAICSTVNLTSGDITYSATIINSNYSQSFETVADLGTETPAQVTKDYSGWAVIKDGFRRRQIAPMPEICKEPARESFERLAEADGIKHVPSAAQAAPAAPSIARNQTSAE